MRALLLGTALLLAGCTGIMDAGYQGYKTEAVTAVQTFDDNALQAKIQALCLTPIGSAVRNQSKIPNLPLLLASACGTLNTPPVQVQLSPVQDSAR